MKFLDRFNKFFGIKMSEEKQLLKKIDFKKLESTLGIKISNKEIYLTALIHRSLLKHYDKKLISNERLEFFGDSVVNLMAAKFLYEKFPDANEGDLTHYRSFLVNKIQLSHYARKINLWNFLLVSNQVSILESSKGGTTIIADAFEAILGAIYFDKGISAVENFLLPFFNEKIVFNTLINKEKNPKSTLLEFLQSTKKEIPRYAVINQEGPHHDSIFTVAVFIGGEEVARGVGKNKKEAEQSAAENALKKLK